MNSSCPSCGAVYTVKPKDNGRRLICKRCQAALFIDETGLRLASGDESQPTSWSPPLDSGTGSNMPSYAPALPEAEESPAPPNATTSLVKRLGVIRDWPAVLFGAGLFCILIFNYFPRIDNAMIASRLADVTAGDITDRSDQDETDAKNNGKPTDADKEARRKRSDEWFKEKERLQLRAALSKTDAERALPWNYRGQLFGYVLLSMAGIGLLLSDSSSTRRLLGGVLLLLIFLVVTQNGVTVRFGPSE